MQSSQNQSTTTGQTTTLPSWLTDASQQAVDIGSQIGSRAYQGYGGSTVAPLSGNEQTAYDTASTQAGAANASGLTSQASMAYTPENVAAMAAPYVQGVIAPQVSALNSSYDASKAKLNSNPQSVAAQNAYDPQGNQKNNGALDTQQTGALSDIEAQGNAAAYNYGQSALLSNRAQAGAITNQLGSELSSSGATQQGINQANDTFNYGQYLENQNWSTNNLESLLSSIKGAQVNTSSTGQNNNVQSQSNLGSIEGAVGTVASIVAMY